MSSMTSEFRPGTTSRRRRRPWIMGGCAVSVVVALSGCGLAGPAAGDDALGVPAGSGKDAYIDALKDIDPITLTMQVTDRQGEGTALPGEVYADAVREWSGGAIDIDVKFSGSVVPLGKMTNALSEGLVDIGTHNPNVVAESFPAYAEAANMMFLHDGSPVTGALQMVMSWMEFSATSPEIAQEFEDNGIKPLIPMLPTAHASAVCGGEGVTSLESMAGKSVRGHSRLVAEQAALLGAVPIDIALTELYEGMERGTLDCTIGSPSTPLLSGLFDVADTWTLDPGLMFPAASPGFDMSLATWESLPLAAQQLMVDLLPVYIDTYIRHSVLDLYVDALAAAEAGGVEIVFDADADIKEALAANLKAHRDELAAGGESAELLAAAEDIHAAWLDAITSAVGDEVPWDDYAEWLAADHAEFDEEITPLIDSLSDTIVTELRPQ